MSRVVDLVGKRFSRLTVLSFASLDKRKSSMWLCKCDCGNEKIIRGSSLNSGSTKSCGCFNHEVRINQKIFLTHGMSKTRQFKIWCHMIQRCNDTNSKDYEGYGARGITVCERWLKFENFWEDMQEGYLNKLTIDRINTNKGYYKENCKWSTPTEQANNRRTNIFFTAFGITDTLANLCRTFNANYKSTFARIKYQNVDIETALSKSNIK